MFYNGKVKKLLIAASLAFILASCGYQGHYRYECQDPENWENKECNPPTCEIENVCWKDLVGIEEES